MPSATAETAVRDYLRALKDPASLRDDETINELGAQLEKSDDPVERLRLRQQLLELEAPPLDRHEQAFRTHARAWAEDHGISLKAFTDEGVPNDVLRKAGFQVGGRRGRGARGSARPRRSRVTTEQVRAAIPKGPFTIKHLQDVSGASPAVVRKVVAEEEASSRLRSEGTDPDHHGPGRAPVLYRPV
ncbi:MAG: hypothetical protein GEU81_00705 [Nitriliruptorales bacterium]|nr:hypothetical protein [Nitriliruptorales bacterium]